MVAGAWILLVRGEGRRMGSVLDLNFERFILIDFIRLFKALRCYHNILKLRKV